ncbi:glycoside hydrolase family 43 protein [Alicyclobacillus fastidiosus]|uniref:Glycoside hydrolase family 43 protein n=1 Tax=Alicyclobacillus fastidiosus TaxID=392011 RepID=A0ABY6ZBA4_9BACL|nr:glycoside hydrolase family 43 protein [Alicyclobacillus fastidiosus]WAH40048.1 glycoside hydrolase family 43 protein [Alicyclobacillus fastidiosus]GMA61354.1 glycosyl hydrolase family 43 [Alicyclobacillus fastidiosus]
MSTGFIHLLEPGEPWLDSKGEMIQAHGGGVLLHGGRYYWFGENRDVSRKEAKVLGVSCYSSTDLTHWQDEGVVLPTVYDNQDHDLYFTQVVERPKVIYNHRSGEFVMIMHIDSPDYKYARVGFAFSQAPDGPYQYVGSIRPNGAESRDMTVFQDDDGKSYLIYSSEGNATMHVAELSDDYRSLTGVYCRIFEGQYREAPAVFKYESKYYMITSGCTGWKSNEAQWAVADSMLGPWRTLGNPCVGPDAEKTFYTQSTFVLALEERPGSFVFMADRWKPDNLRDSRYIWLPFKFTEDGQIEIRWETYE